MKVLTVVGARPQFIKSAPVSRAFQKAGVQECILHTGQHYDANMSAVFFQELDIKKPDHNLGVGSGSHGEQTGKMLIQIEKVLEEEAPDWVLVYGDTNSTLAGALASVKRCIPVAHVEAGLRSYNREMPEEINRIVTDHIATLLFCPTQTAVENLRAEGIGTRCSSTGRPRHPTPLTEQEEAAALPKRLSKRHSEPRIVLSGDIMYDSVLMNCLLAQERSTILYRLRLVPKDYALATVHRAENTESPRRLAGIFGALEKISGDGLPVVVPLHPRTRKRIEGTVSSFDSLILVDPVSYLDMLLLEKSARIIFTDSGGVQKEAYWLKIPCITLREETEWVETVDDGWNILSGADRDKIVESARKTDWPSHQSDPFGDGRSADKIVSALATAERELRCGRKI